MFEIPGGYVLLSRSTRRSDSLLISVQREQGKIGYEESCAIFHVYLVKQISTEFLPEFVRDEVACVYFVGRSSVSGTAGCDTPRLAGKSAGTRLDRFTEVVEKIVNITYRGCRSETSYVHFFCEFKMCVCVCHRIYRIEF